MAATLSSRKLYSALALTVCIMSSAFVTEANGQATGTDVLVTVNGKKITEATLRSYLLSRRIPESQWPGVREKLLEDVIDRELIREFLKENKATANEVQLERQLALSRKVAEATGDQLDDVLKRLGLTEQTLKDELALPLAWNAYVSRVITESQIAERFKKKTAHYDGTKVTARQIFLKVSPDASASDIATKKNTLSDFKKQIENSETTFEAAAMKHSESPSGKKGGDIGSFRFKGRMPAEITKVAFGLKKGEISKPFQSKFGLHLLQVTKITPGQFSLEDARPSIFDDLSDEIYESTVKKLRSTARIVK